MRAPRFTFVEILTATAVLGETALAIALWLNPTGRRVPMHFTIDGAVDRWGDTGQAAAFIGFMAALTLVVVAVLGVSLRKPDVTAARRKGFAAAQAVVLFATVMSVGIIAAGATGIAAGPDARTLWQCVLPGGIGALVGKVPPNRLVGIRTPWSRRSRLAWDRSNRLAGWLLMTVGLVGAVFVLSGYSVPTAWIVLAVVAAVLAAAYESWRVWRADPERQP